MIEGDQHKFLRKNTAPAFHFRHIKELYPMMWNKAGILTGAFGREIQKNRAHGLGNPATIELSAWASKVTLDIIGVAGLGRNFDAVEKQEDPLQGIYEQLLEPSREKIVFAMLSLGFGLQLIRLLPWKMNDLFNHLTTSLNNYCWPMIHEKRLAVAAKEDDHFDVLSLLIRSNNFSDETLKDQLLTFLAAGFVLPSFNPIEIALIYDTDTKPPHLLLHGHVTCSLNIQMFKKNSAKRSTKACQQIHSAIHHLISLIY